MLRRSSAASKYRPHSEIYLQVNLFLNYTLYYLAYFTAENPWNHGTMIRSNVWFDTLQKSLKSESFVNPMLTSFHSIVEDSAEDGFAGSNTEKTSLDSFDSINDEDPPYENYPRSKRDAVLVQRSKSLISTRPAKKTTLLVSNQHGDIQMRPPSIRFSTTAARKSDQPLLKRSMTFASADSSNRRFRQHQIPLR